MDALETLMRPAVAVLNRNIPEITRARELCAELAGKTIAIRVRKSGLNAFFSFDEQSISLSSQSDIDPDVVISGSLLALGGLAATGNADAIRGGDVDLSGDAATAQAFQELMAAARPDLEEGVSSLVGDAAAHSLGTLARNTQRWAEDARSTMGANIREYVQEESQDAPSRYEVERFAGQVATLRDDVDRLAARIDRLQQGKR